MEPKHEAKLSFFTNLGYGVGSLSYAIPFQVVSACLVFYSTAVLGISGALTGFIIFISIIWDALTDPVMGYISDHTSPKIFLGRRLFYVLTGAVGLALCNGLLWRIDPALPRETKAFSLGLLLLLLKTFSTVYATPYLALGAELSADYHERTTVQSYRTAFFFLGFMFPTIIGMAVFFRPTPEFLNGQLNPAAYQSLGDAGFVITLVCAAVCIALTHRKGSVSEAAKTKKNPLLGIFRETAQALRCAEFRNVSLGLMFVNVAMGIVGAIGLHVFTYTFGFSNRQIAVVFGALFLMALVAQPAWAYVARKTEKRRALLWCLSVSLAASALFLLGVLASEWLADRHLIALPLAMLMGFSIGGSIALPYSMISDTIDKDAYHSGTRKEGVFYGCATFMFKVSQSLAVLFVGVLLDIIRFDSNQIQPHSVYIRMGLILPIGLLLCFSLALVFVRKYTLDRKTVTQYQTNSFRTE